MKNNIDFSLKSDTDRKEEILLNKVLYENLKKNIYNSNLEVKKKQLTFTPFSYIRKSIQKAINNLDGIVQVHNIEFIPILVKEYNINPKNIVLYVDTRLKDKVACTLYSVENFIFEFDKKHIFNVNNKKPKRVDTVKFSAILGNPVYDKNLHLKILKDVIKHLEDDGICVWLHPARWIQDPLAPYKGKRSDYGKFKDLPWGDFEIITRGEANRKFNIKNDSDLVISTLNPNSRIDINPLVDKEQLSILEKVQSKMKQSLGSLSEKNKINGIRVPLKSIVPLIGSGNRDFTYKLFAYDVCYDYFTKDGFLEDGKYWTTRAQKNQYTKSEGATSPLSIEFNTENEARNFINSTNTEVYKFINIITKNDMHTQLNYLPFLGDYSFEWDNNDISSYFDFDSDEVNYIMNNIKNYT